MTTKRIGLVLAAVFCGVLGGCGDREVTSTGVLQVNPVRERVLFHSDDNREAMAHYEAYVTSQMAVMQTSRVLERAWADAAWRKVHPSMSEAEKQAFKQHLKVEHPANSELIRISYTARDGQEAQAAVRSVVHAYMEMYGEADIKRVTVRMDVLETRRSMLRDQVAGLEKRRRDIGAEFGTDDLAAIYAAKLEATLRLEMQLRELQATLATTKNTGPEVQQRYEVVKTMLDYARRDLLAVGEKNMKIKDLLTEEQTARANLAETNHRIDELNTEQQVSGLVKVISDGDLPESPELSQR